ncbi:hypothetical protein PPS_1898 [Pseudomonas putida S16]|nr:hypothetical protein PPS_1898 [Pseudomonas putida S16]AJG14643.1 hypothetical protein RK21_03135 [Pseudomonas plecoglossicida]
MTACAGLFAGKPAPTGPTQRSNAVVTLWERASPRRGRHSQNRLIARS